MHSRARIADLNPVSSPSATVTHVVIAEQNRLHADALRLACLECFADATVHLHVHGMQALRALAHEPADLLVMGLSFDDIDGVALLEEVNRGRLAQRTVIVSSQWEEHILLSLRTARFDGAVDTATESFGTIRQVMALVAAGEGYISASLRKYLIDELPADSGVHELTAMELRVIRVIGEGFDNQEAAARLGICMTTVQTHRRNIMRKLRVATSAKLVHEAVRLGLVRITPAGPPVTGA